MISALTLPTLKDICDKYCPTQMMSYCKWYKLNIGCVYISGFMKDVACLHNGPTMTHTNGDIECLSCNEIIGRRE